MITRQNVTGAHGATTESNSARSSEKREVAWKVRHGRAPRASTSVSSPMLHVSHGRQCRPSCSLATK